MHTLIIHVGIDIDAYIHLMSSKFVIRKRKKEKKSLQNIKVIQKDLFSINQC